jgi:hypothetical protein
MPAEDHMQNLRPGVINTIDDRVIINRTAGDKPGKHVKTHAGQGQSANHCQPTKVFHGNSQPSRLPVLTRNEHAMELQFL